MDPLDVNTLSADEKVFWDLGHSADSQSDEAKEALKRMNMKHLPIVYWIARLNMFAKNMATLPSTWPLDWEMKVAGAYVVTFECASKTRKIGWLEFIAAVTPFPTDSEYPAWFWLSHLTSLAAHDIEPDEPAVQNALKHLNLHEVPPEYWNTRINIAEARVALKAK